MKEKIDNDYEPKPLDTSGVKLPHELDEKIEQLARNNHDVWAKERQQGGWTYGLERDDARKEHPSMVPYEQLPESEKDVDRETVEQTLKAAVALGCKIRVAEREVASSGDQELHSSDDMLEWPPLPTTFKEPKKALLDIYRNSDRQAKSRLREHQWTVGISAFCGTLAVTAAILELAPSELASSVGELLRAVPEFVFALFALAAVLIGLYVALAPKWLLERHRAERCRFAKYRVLMHLAAAGNDSNALHRCLEHFKIQVQEIASLDQEDLEQFMEEDPIPEDAPSVQTGEKVHHNLVELADHYVKYRLGAQAKYFLTQSRKKTAVDAPLRVISPLLFFASILFAFVHFVSAGLDEKAWFQQHHLTLDWKGWVFLAALLPVAGGMFRLLRSAFEYSRNTVRYRAKYRALEQLIVKLESSLAPNQDFHANEIVHSMWKGELILEQEHREWLRLMTEAEWFG